MIGRTRIGMIAISLAILIISGAAQAADRAKPNVLFIAVDDLNDWVGVLGGHPQAHTPNIDRLAQRGVLFTNAHCQAPICGPSRTSLLSGRLPSTTGVYGQITPGKLAENATLRAATWLPNWFANHGYKTMAAGKIFHGGSAPDAFQEYGGGMGGPGPKPKQRINYTPPDNPWGPTQTDWGAYPDSDDEMPDTKVAAWAIEKLKQQHEQPFFLAVGFTRPHVPWYVPAHWFKRYPLDDVKTPVVPEEDMDDLPPIARRLAEMPMMPDWRWMNAEPRRLKEATQAYLASVEFVDSRVGMVLDALDASPHKNNTMIVLFSDHGYHMGEKHRWTKHSLWERATRVVLTIAMPGSGGGAGKQCERPVGLIDLYPTLTDLCGIPANTANEGRSLAPLLNDPAMAWDHPVLTTYGRLNHAAQDERYRYIRYEDGSEELYDHAKDPAEWDNIAAAPGIKQVKQGLADAFPKVNAAWSKPSTLSTNAYFDDHIARHSKPGTEAQP